MNEACWKLCQKQTSRPRHRHSAGRSKTWNYLKHFADGKLHLTPARLSGKAHIFAHLKTSITSSTFCVVQLKRREIKRRECGLKLFFLKQLSAHKEFCSPHLSNSCYLGVAIKVRMCLRCSPSARVCSARWAAATLPAACISEPWGRRKAAQC